MNKSEILKCLSAFPYDRNEYWIITGGAMVIYGIREQTSDIDLGCSAKMADVLEANGYLLLKTDDGKRWFKFNDKIEIFEEWPEDATENSDGFRIVSLNDLMEMKKKLGRKKDMEDIKSIKAWIKLHHGGKNDSI